MLISHAKTTYFFSLVLPKKEENGKIRRQNKIPRNFIARSTEIGDRNKKKAVASKKHFRF